MAIAAKWLARPLNGRLELFDFDVYAICGDGCLMEGISTRPPRSPATCKLDNLCWIYDNNHITIDGNTAARLRATTSPTRFVGYGWNVHRVGDANDSSGSAAPSRSSRPSEDRPTLIIVDSHIGYGSPHKQDTAAAHGEPLGEEEVRETKRAYGWPEDAQFLVPDGRPASTSPPASAPAAPRLRADWEAKFAELRRESSPSSPPRSSAMQRRELPDGWDADIPTFPADAKGIASREASQQGR